MDDTTPRYATAIGHTAVSQADFSLREVRRDAVQLAGYGAGTELCAWIEQALRGCAGPNAALAVLNGRAQLLGVAPATWLLLGDPGLLRDIARRAEQDCAEIAAITDFSDGRCVMFELSGAIAADVLAMHIGIDLACDMTRPDAIEPGGAERIAANTFAPGGCIATGIHGVPVVIVRRAVNTFEIVVQRSFAHSVWEVLLDSSHGVPA